MGEGGQGVGRNPALECVCNKQAVLRSVRLLSDGLQTCMTWWVGATSLTSRTYPVRRARAFDITSAPCRGLWFRVW